MNTKKIVLFGASGSTGKFVADQALQSGYHVTAIVRKPEQFNINHPNLNMIKGDVLQLSAIEKSIHEEDLVISCLGVRDRKPTNLYSSGISNIITLMHMSGARRIICLSAVAVVIPPKSSVVVKFITKYILQRVFKFMYADLLLMEKIISNSGLDWTVVRPPRLTNGNPGRKVRAAINEPLSNPSNISRADLADYILNQLSGKQTFKSIVEVSY